MASASNKWYEIYQGKDYSHNNTFTGDFLFACSTLKVTDVALRFYAFKPFTVKWEETGYIFNSAEITTYTNIRDNLYNNPEIDRVIADEIYNILLNNHLYVADSGGFGDAGVSFNRSDTTNYLNASSNILYPYGATTVGTNSQDIWNKYGDEHSGVLGTTPMTVKDNDIMPLLNLLQYGFDNDLFEGSDELKSFINQNFTPIVTDWSVNWDIYILTKNPTMIANETTGILIRWSCNAVNQGTPEFIALHPDYKYKYTNTTMYGDVGNSKTALGNNVFNAPYGLLEKELSANTIFGSANINQLAEAIGSVAKFTSLGDAYISLWAMFADDVQQSSVVRAQIPANSVTQDVSHLWTQNGADGSTVTLHYGAPTSGVPDDVLGWNDDARDFFDDDDVTENPSKNRVTPDYGTNSNISLLTQTYAIDEQNLRALGSAVWSGDFADLIDAVSVSPLENILSVKSFPFALSGGAGVTVKLGNVDIEGCKGHLLSSGYNPIKQIGQSFEVVDIFANTPYKWLAFSPYSSYSLFLPYIGIVELDPQTILSSKDDPQYKRVCTLKYIYDVILGECTAVLYVKQGSDAAIEVAKWSGNIAIDIPITSSNRAQVEMAYITGGIQTAANFIGGAVGAGASIASGNAAGGIASLIGTVGNAVTGAINTATTPFHSQTNGTPSPACDAFDLQNAFLILNRPLYNEPSLYAHLYGRPCNMTRKLKDLKGFTKCASVHIDGIPCTDEEREQIAQLLRNGVYL